METINVSVHPDISHIPNGMEQMIERSKNMSSADWDRELRTIKRDQMAVEDAIVRDRRRQSYSHSKSSQHSTTNETGKKPQYPIDMHRFTKMADEVYEMAKPILGRGYSFGKDILLMVEYALTFSTDFEDYLTSIGVSDNLMSKILHRYEVYHKGDHDMVFFRMNKHGETLNGNIVTFDKEGKVEGCRRVFSHHSYYDMFWSFGTAFFGGHLLSKVANKRDFVFIVQDELTALLGAMVYPTRLWLALGMGQNLTEDHLKLLEGQRAILYPDDMAEPYWAELASKFPNVNVNKSFVDKDMTDYFVNTIKRRRK